MPEEECSRCGIILDGAQHNCEFREPACLGYELILINTAATELARYLEMLENRYRV